MKKLTVYFIPLILFITLAIYLLLGLYKDPRNITSSLIGIKIPEFYLPDVMHDNLYYDNSVFQGETTLLNVWGTWCVTCAVELPYLKSLSDKGIRVIGLYYPIEEGRSAISHGQDPMKNDIKLTLKRFGNPFKFNILDIDHGMAIDLGVTGAPETFLINKGSIIVQHHRGELTEKVWKQKFATLYKEANQ